MKKFSGVLFLVVFVYAATVFSQPAVSPVDQVDFLLKILKYNNTIAESATPELRVGIIYANVPESTKSYQAYDDALFEKVKAKETIVGKKLTYSGLLFSTEDGFLKTMGALQFNVFLILDGNDNNLASVCKIAREKGIMTFSGVKRYLNNGVTTGVENIDGQNKVVINLDSANAVGTSFKAGLLNIAKVIKS